MFDRSDDPTVGTRMRWCMAVTPRRTARGDDDTAAGQVSCRFDKFRGDSTSQPTYSACQPNVVEAKFERTISRSQALHRTGHGRAERTGMGHSRSPDVA